MKSFTNRHSERLRYVPLDICRTVLEESSLDLLRTYPTLEVLAVAGEQWRVGPGDVLVFRGDQRHSYTNPGRDPAVGYSVVLLTRTP